MTAAPPASLDSGLRTATALLHSSMEPRRRTRLLILVLLVTFAAYLPALWHGFTQDDCYLVQVTGNPRRPNAMVAEWQGFAACFGTHYWEGVWPSGDLYRPITILSYAATHALFGSHLVSEAFPHHLLNVLLHVLGTFLTYRLLRVLRCGDAACLLGALTFGLHAIRVEAVAGIVGRAELLAFAAGAAALLLWHGARQPDVPTRRRCFALAGGAVLLFVAFGSKESALAWVPFFPVFAFASGARLGPASLGALGCAALPLAAYFALRALALSDLPEPLPVHFMANPLAHEAATLRVATGLFLSVFGLYASLLPFDLCSDYGPQTFALASGFADPRTLGALALIVALLALGCAWARRQPLLFLAVATFFGFSFITSNVPFATGTIFAERLAYTPALAVSFLVAALVPHLAWWTVLLWLVPVAAALEARLPAWRDDPTLFAVDVEKNPRSLRLLTGWSDTLRLQGPEHLAAAVVPMRRALALEPQLATAWYGLGALLVQQSQLATDAATARALLVEAAATVRAGVTATLANPDSERWRAEAVLGSVCLRLGELDEAERWLRSALERRPVYREAWMDFGRLGDALVGGGQTARARAVFAAIASSEHVSVEMRQGAAGRLQMLR